MRPLWFLILGPPVGLAVGAGIGAAIAWTYTHRMERAIERDWA